MSAGVNYVGGRGRIAPRRAKNTERLPKAHFAKQRFIDYTQTAQGDGDTTDPKATPIISFRHALLGNKTQTGATLKSADSQLRNTLKPSVIDKPWKPTKPSKLLDMMDSSIRQNESFDTSRSRISTMDLSRYLGLDTSSRKRKFEQEMKDASRKRPFSHSSQAFSYPKYAGPRGFVFSPVKKPTSLEASGYSDTLEILSFSTSSIDNRDPISPRSSSPIVSPHETHSTETPKEANPKLVILEPKPLKRLLSPSISPSLGDKAYLQAARTMGLDVALPLTGPPTPKGMSPGTSLDTWITSNGYSTITSDPHDETVYAFNLLAPGAPDSLAKTANTANEPSFSNVPESSEQFECNSPVIMPIPNQGAGATTETETEPYISQVEQPSKFADTVQPGVGGFPFLPHPIWGPPETPAATMHSPSSWLEGSSTNIVVVNTLPREPVPRNKSDTKPQTQDQPNTIARHLGLNSWNGEKPEMNTSFSQSSVDSTQSSQIIPNSLTLFDDVDTGSDY